MPMSPVSADLPVCVASRSLNQHKPTFSQSVKGLQGIWMGDTAFLSRKKERDWATPYPGYFLAKKDVIVRTCVARSAPMYTYIHTYIRAYIHIHIHTSIHACTHTHSSDLRVCCETSTRRDRFVSVFPLRLARRHRRCCQRPHPAPPPGARRQR